MPETGSPDLCAAGCVVAIVDDDPAIRTALGRLTRALGYVPALFDGAERLLADSLLTDSLLADPLLADSWLPDPSGLRIAAIVTDLQMPGLSGLDLLRILRRRRPALPVLVMTAHPSETGRARALALGAFAYLAKPFDAAQFEHCLTVALGSAGPP